MKYFEIQDTLELKNAPELKNWYGKFDVRDIKLDTFYKLPKRQLFIIEPSEKTIYTDVILFPFLLVTLKVKDVIAMYKDRCFFREVFLLNQVSGKSEVYYLPVLDESSCIQLARKTYSHGTCVVDQKNVRGEAITVEKNIFWVRDSIKRHTIISQDLVESLLRRGTFGIGLQEVMLYTKVRG